MKNIKIDDDFKNLLPPLSDDEFSRLEKEILNDGIREKLIVWDGFLIDGHNRFSIANKHDLKFEVDEKDFANKEEAVNWMLNNQLGRRNLSPAKRVDVVLQAEDLIKRLYEKSKGAQGKRNDLTSGSHDPNVGKSHNTREEIAKLTETSPGTVQRMKKIKKEDPDLYGEVVKGNKNPYAAYKELPSVKSNLSKKSEPEQAMNEEKKPIEEPKKQYNQQPPDLPPEELERQMFDANVTTLFRHLQEIEGFIGRTERFEEVVKEGIKRDSASMTDYAKALEKTINLIKAEVF